MASSVEKKKEKAKMSKLKEWVDSLIFALVVATLIRGLFIEPFVIPTSSMEGSLLRGDYLFVSKMAYGARTPKTVLQFPLAHQKIWGTEFNSYVEWITMPYFRLPGIGSVSHDDAVVFNYPYDTLHPVDQRVHYIKRCIGLPGDTLSIESNQAYINGKATANPEKMQHLYQLNTKGNKVINERIFEKLDITEFIRTSRSLSEHRLPIYFTLLKKQKPTSKHLTSFSLLQKLKPRAMTLICVGSFQSYSGLLITLARCLYIMKG